jgi:hypothetical protein
VSVRSRVFGSPLSNKQFQSYQVDRQVRRESMRIRVGDETLLAQGVILFFFIRNYF